MSATVIDPDPAHSQHWLVDLAVFAPLGILAGLVEDVPKQVAQRRQAVENRVQVARFIGKLAVQQGRKELTKRLGAHRVVSVEPALPARLEADEEFVAGSPLEEMVDTIAVPTDPSPLVDSLPIEDYDSLAASHVVGRLASLHPDELELVRRYEHAHRARRTILGKIDQIQVG